MSIKISILAFFIFFLFGCSDTNAMSEQDVRSEIKRNVQKLFQDQKYEELNTLADRYLNTEERTPSGVWKHTVFYGGLFPEIDKKDTSIKHWEDLEKKSLQWIKQHPKKPYGYLAYASFGRNHAWEIRGNGYVHEVDKKNWKSFHKKNQQLIDFLEENKAVASQDPRWYGLMMTFLKRENVSDEAFTKVLDESIERFPYYYRNYFDATTYYMPRWGGSKEKMEEFAQKVVRATFEKENYGMYARIYWSYSSWYRSLIKKTNVVWPYMSQSIDVVLSKYPVQWNINHFGYLSCSARDKNKTKLLIKKIEGEPNYKAWRGKKYFEYCKRWSFG